MVLVAGDVVLQPDRLLHDQRLQLGVVERHRALLLQVGDRRARLGVLARLGARRVPDRASSMRAPGASRARRQEAPRRASSPGSWSSAASGSPARARSRTRAGSDRTRDRSRRSSAPPRRSCSCRSRSRRPPCCRSAARRRSTCRACGRPPRRRRRSSRSSGRSCVQPLTIWMRSRLPEVGSFTAQTMNVGALALAGGRSPPIGTPFA